MSQPSSMRVQPDEHALWQLAYVSTQTVKLDAAGMAALLEECRLRNQALGITGMLLHRDDTYFQVLEGRQAAIEEVYRLINMDKRHERVQRLFYNPLDAREFSDWLMAFKRLDGLEAQRIDGFSDFLVNRRAGVDFINDQSMAKRFIVQFREML